ncbi:MULTISPECIES: MFS transporter [Enterobacteriaceae]|uniref:MFS transporter n=1 Tax=Kluyvera genomosp. 2 TaxID=2774054 RepID=A0A2T2Y0J4_9ENTR|nr:MULTISPECIES: MFS transporter [Enterobacteriaceae]HAT3919290.1 MFS transporter [Kluyvera ascorbata]PSR46055.1 MFS transporter [Kluyvera genomosp. 2]BBQ85117.1 MFS transporter [Klebsiella sp. WP3-W18-ESBL-02]BBR22169.1 MFS transporter [Klebsiella sp. WP3-S18-ESBL-05]BBR57672.1 MFS transporter [Klebsiella sp. WP4-W18-ESBL-05]
MRTTGHTRWFMVALVTLGTILCYLTRNTISAAAPTLQDNLHITTQQYSWIVATFSACYTIAQPVAGYVLDTLGTKVGYTLFGAMWGIFCIGAAFTSSWQGLALCRGLGGFAESAMIPAGLKSVTEWFPDGERSVAVGYFNVGSSMGAIIAPPMVAWAIYIHSWRLAFIIVGIASVIWALGWYLVYNRPGQCKSLSKEEYNYITAGQPEKKTVDKVHIGQLLRQRKFWGIALPRFLAEPAWGTFNAWIPLFMVHTYGFDLKDIAMFAWIPMLFADMGCVIGGYLPGIFQRAFGVNIVVSRKLVVTMGAALMILPGMVGLFSSPFVAIALLCVGGFAHQSLSGALITLSADLFDANEVATANGFTGMAAWTASTLFALVVGALADTLGFSPLFAVLAAFDVIGAVILWALLKSPQPQQEVSPAC